MKGKIAIITGGERGLGKALAVLLRSKGVEVVICGVEKEELEKTANELGVTPFFADVSEEEEVKNAARETLARFGAIDIWINNAGVWIPRMPIEEIDTQKAKRLFEVNVFGSIFGMKSAVAAMKDREGGTIINILSTTVFPGGNGSSSCIYTSSKSAIKGFAEALREELKGTAIRIINAYPGGIKTDLFNEKIPANIGDFMTPESVSEKIVANLEKENPELDLIIKRPGQSIIL